MVLFLVNMDLTVNWIVSRDLNAVQFKQLVDRNINTVYDLSSFLCLSYPGQSHVSLQLSMNIIGDKLEWYYLFYEPKQINLLQEIKSIS